MQRVGAYLLERYDDMRWFAARSAELERLKTIVRQWLVSKGATADAANGSYRPDDGSTGAFKIDAAVHDERETWFVELREQTTEGRVFAATVWLTAEAEKVSVYITLEAGWKSSRISPFYAEPRCPRIVRELLGQREGWHHGGSVLRTVRSISGFDQGEALAADIEQPERTTPLVVVSTEGGETVFPGIENQVAHELAGLANVVRIDEEASWALTDALGVRLGCFLGAIRIYWPGFKGRREPAAHPLWTADRLRGLGPDATRTSERLRSQIRRSVFGAAALSVSKPPAIDEIREGAQRSAFGSLRDRLKSLQDIEEFLPLYEKENTDLLNQRAQLRAEVVEQTNQIANLKAECAALRANLESVNSWQAEQEAADIAPAPAEDPAAKAPPQPGEVRFYKKRHATPNHDVMISFHDCGHNNWEAANAAPKAKKGIARFEQQDNWDRVQHCASCEGGGVWRVRW